MLPGRVHPDVFVTRTFVRYIRHRADRGAPPKWWEPRNIHIGSMHIHHVVVGVVLVMLSGVSLVTLALEGNQAELTTAAIFSVSAQRWCSTSTR